MSEVTVSDLIKLLDKEKNRRGGATGKERILSIQVNGEFIGYITSAKLDGWGDGLITDVCLEVETEWKYVRFIRLVLNAVCVLIHGNHTAVMFLKCRTVTNVSLTHVSIK